MSAPEHRPASPPRPVGEASRVWWIALAALAIGVLRHLIAGDIGLGLGDEGYLWNNIQRTVQGDVPIRDFRSYDPGRYYWGALFAHLFGADFWSVRLAESAALALGLWAALQALARALGNRLVVVALGASIAFSAFPMHKSFDIALVMLAVLVLVRLAEEPCEARYLQTGIAIGFTALTARNIAFYFLCGALLVSFTALRREAAAPHRRLAGLLAGAALGYSPMIALATFSPGMLAALTDSVARLTGSGAPVSSLPAPWPWTLELDQLRSATGRSLWALGLAQSALVLGHLAGLWAVLRHPRTREPLFLASLAIGVPCLHHALTRADYPHLATVAFPAIAALVAAWSLSRKRGMTLLAGIAVTALVLFLGFLTLRTDTLGMLGRRTLSVWSGAATPTPYLVDGRNVWVPAAQAAEMREVDTLIARTVAPGAQFFFAPFLPGYYLLHGTTAPVWDAFPIHRASAAEERAMIRDLERRGVRVALIDTRPLDGIPGREFAATHPLVWQYLERNFERDLSIANSTSLILFRRIDAVSKFPAD